MRVAFCTTCRDRIWQKDAFLRNLWLSVRWKDVEFVLIDYGSSDGLRDWIITLPPVLKQNLKYYRTEAPCFNASHAKNVAHLAAHGDILINLDFDNFLVPEYAEGVRQIIGEGFVYHNFTPGQEGTMGRIGFARSDFLRLRGYDEAFIGLCYEDPDILYRAVAAGMIIERGHMKSSDIKNRRGTPERRRFTAYNKEKGQDIHRLVNPDGFGRAHLVDLNGDCFLTGYPSP